MATSYNIQEWRNERGKLFHQMKDIHARAAAEGRGLGQDEQEQWDKLHARDNELVSLIQREEDIQRRNAEFEQQVEVSKPAEKLDERKTWSKFLKRGLRGLNAEERKFVETRGTDTQVTTTDGLGGYLVPEFWAAQIYEYMKNYAGVLDAAQIVRTATGGTLNFPYTDETSVIGAIIAEGVGDTVADNTLQNLQIGAYTYTSKVIKVSKELANDAGYNVDAYVQSIASKRIGRIWNQHLTTGSGTNQPKGVVTASTLGNTTSAVNAFTRAEMLGLLHSVDPAYRANARWMLNDLDLKKIKLLTVGSGDDRPLWQPGIAAGEPDTIEGYPYIVNNDMGDSADGASTKFMLFGDFSNYIVRIVQDFQLERLAERYAEERVYGYFLWARMDGDLLDTSSVKHMITAAS